MVTQPTLRNQPVDTGARIIVRHVRDVLMADYPDGGYWLATGFVTVNNRTWSCCKLYLTDRLDPDDPEPWRIHCEILRGKHR